MKTFRQDRPGGVQCVADREILLVDDDYAVRDSLSETLLHLGYKVACATGAQEALRLFSPERIAAVVTDVKMPGTSGIELLKAIKTTSPATPVIVMTAYGTVNTAVEAMKEGAADFLMKPFSAEQLEISLKNALLLGTAAEKPKGKEQLTIITGDGRIKGLLEVLQKVAKSKASVLIQGESGTGKELFARFVHYQSDRRDRPFVAVNCAAIPGNLLESEMFGYEKGAFTGAGQRKLGKFELADGGTLLLDEIGEMDVQLQAKLLRAIQEREVDRVGGHEPIPVDVRIIATTNADLLKAIEEKRFRSDLYYRLSVVPIKIPPLRERRGDIELLSDFFLKKYSEQSGLARPILSPEALQLLHAHPWPGNVRELENVIERAVLLCRGGKVIPQDLRLEDEAAPGQAPPPVPLGEGRTMTLRDMERNLIFETLRKVNGNKTRASQLLGVSVRTVRNKLSEYQMEDLS